MTYLLVSQSVHVAGGSLLAASGILVGLLALSVQAPLGVVRICSPKVHLVLIRVLSVSMTAALVVPASRPDLEGIVIVLFAAVALILLSTRTAVRGGWGRRRKGWRRDGAIDATATVAQPRTPPAQSPPGDVDSDSTIRRVGRTTGAAAAAGKRAVDEHRPVVEHQVKRGLRGAGRLAARLAGPKSPPDPPA